MSNAAEDGPRVGPSFLLSQLGHHASQVFAERLRPLELTPQQVGILRLLAKSASPFTQTTLGGHLGLLPSRLVVLLDELEARGLVDRRPNPADRRSNHLRLTRRGQTVFARAERIADALDHDMFACLSDNERDELTRILHRLARHRGLLPGVHPAYRGPTDLES